MSIGLPSTAMPSYPHSQFSFICKFSLSKMWEISCCMLTWRAAASQESSVHHHSRLYSQQCSTQHVLLGCWNMALWPLVMICCVRGNVLIMGQGESGEAGQTRFFHPRCTPGRKNCLVGCVRHRPDREVWGESGLSSLTWFLTCKCIMVMGYFEA